MSIETLLYHSGMLGMPSATLAAAGGLTALLDPLLVDGVNLRSVTSLTRTGDVVTAEIDGSNNFQIGEVVEVAGASPSAYNTRHRVTARTTSTVSWVQTGSPATPATGTITIKHPACGWTRQQFAENVVAYRDGGALGHYMQIEDNNPYTDSGASARTRMAVGLTALDTADQLNDQHRIQKANSWVLVADARSVFLVMNAANTFHFGEIQSNVPADAYAWHQNRGESASFSVQVFGSTQTYGRHSPIAGYHSSNLPIQWPISAMRDVSQAAANALLYPAYLGVLSANSSIMTLEFMQRFAVPSGADGSVPLFPVVLSEWGGNASSFHVRGGLRGAYFPLGRLTESAFTNNVAMLDNVVIGGVTRRIALVRFGFVSVGQIAFDLTGSWD